MRRSLALSQQAKLNSSIIIGCLNLYFNKLTKQIVHVLYFTNAKQCKAYTKYKVIIM